MISYRLSHAESRLVITRRGWFVLMILPATTLVAFIVKEIIKQLIHSGHTKP